MTAKLDTLVANIAANTLTTTEKLALGGALSIISPLFDTPDNVSDAIPSSQEEPLARLWYAALYAINAAP